MRFAQLVIGPAGCGKSTYCTTMVQHGIDNRRSIEVVNLDPAAEHFDYQPMADIRDLIQVQDTMESEDLHFGPNGGLIFCLEYLVENSEWLRDQLGEQDDDYILFDCPGQIELYTHLPVMSKLIKQLIKWDFKICAVYLMDSQYMTDGAKFLSGTMAALSVMMNLELPHLNLLSKVDMLPKSVRKRLERFLIPDAHTLMGDIESVGMNSFNEKYRQLSEVLGHIIEDFALVRFTPLNIKDPESLTDILVTIDNVIQYGEDQEVRTFDFEGEN